MLERQTYCDRLGGGKVMVRETDVTVTDWEGRK